MSSKRNQALEGLRGLAALNVFMGHFLFSFFPYIAHLVRPYPGAYPRYWFETLLLYPPFTFLYLADAAVPVFFVLSGYVLTKSFYENGDLRQFQGAAVKRYIRLVLPAFVSVMFAWTLLVLGAYGNGFAADLGAAGWVISAYDRPVTLIGAVFRGLVGAPIFARNDLNVPLWTLQIELVGSILLYACYSLFGNRSRLFLVFWFLFFALMVTSGSSGILHYSALLSGSLIHLVERRLRASALLSGTCLLLGLVLVSFNYSSVFKALYSFPLPNFQPYGPNLGSDYRILWHTIGANFLVAGVLGLPSAAKMLNMAIPVYLGRISFSLYLLHFPLTMCVSFRLAELGKRLGLTYVSYVGLAFIGTAAILFALSELFYRYVDSPSIRLAGWVAAMGKKKLPKASVVPTLAPDAAGERISL